VSVKVVIDLSEVADVPYTEYAMELAGSLPEDLSLVMAQGMVKGLSDLGFTVEATQTIVTSVQVPRWDEC
jgi:hypothetical protein